MSRPLFCAALLDAGHDRAVFDSGSATLDRYFREQVTQDVRRRVAASFVALTEERRIAGFRSHSA